jgi:zinc-ribbon domain
VRRLRLRKPCESEVLRELRPSLAAGCASCGAENPPGFRFCGECGRPLAPDEPRPPTPDPRAYTPKHLAEKILNSRIALEGERKQVTVLFADVKGALHLQQELRRCADEMRLEHGLGFSVQMGLNSGEVVVGRIGDNLRMDYAAQGRSDRPPSRHLTSLSWKPDFATWKQYGSQLRAARSCWLFRRWLEGKSVWPGIYPGARRI